MAGSLEEIQDQILDLLHAGEPVDREEVLARHPQHADDLRVFLDLITVIEDEAPAPAPARLGEFRILRELGRGGMGVVYEAEQTSLKRRVALKVLPPSLRMDPRLLSRFQREAEAAGRLRHPGIVPVYSVGEAAGAPFFAMELVEGESLDRLIRRWREEGGAPSRERAVEIATKVADALSYAHGQGILHRDVKPGNIILDGNGEPRLTDFGLALDLHAPGLTAPGEIFGSPQYMSPEQAVRREAPVDERTDVYSLAVTLYELLTLHLPYDASTSAELLTALAAGRLIPPHRFDPAMPRALETVLLRALRKDPRERYGSVAEFAGDLRACLEGRAPAPAPHVRRRRIVLAAAAVLGLAVIGAVVALTRPGPHGSPGLPPAAAEVRELLLGNWHLARQDLPAERRDALEHDVTLTFAQDGAFRSVQTGTTQGGAVTFGTQRDGRWSVLGKPANFTVVIHAAGGTTLLEGHATEHGIELLEDGSWNPYRRAGAASEARADLRYWLWFRDASDAEIAARVPDGATREAQAARLRQAQQVAERFCRDWNEIFQSDEERERNERLAEELRGCGLAAAPYLLDVLAQNPCETFTRIHPEAGTTARMQVRALNGVAFLGLKEAIPYVVMHCRSPSRTQASTAAIVLQQLTGEAFDAQFLKAPDLWKIDWWQKSHASASFALARLVDALLAQLRAGVGKEGWWQAYGTVIVADLEILLNTRFPVRETEEPAAAREDIGRIEEWWRCNRDALSADR